MIAQIVVFSRKTDAQRKKILRFVPQKLRKSFANGNPNFNYVCLGDCSPTALATANGISSWQLSSVLLDLILMHVFQSLRGVNMDPDFI